MENNLKDLDVLSQDLKNISRIADRIRGVCESVSPGNGGWLKVIEDQKDKTDNNVFRVLVMGAFNSGKSSMINALIGEKVLPVGARPATAIITELYYGEEKKVVLYPKPGKWKGGDEPFSIPVADMKKYCLIDNDAEAAAKLDEDTNVIESPFEKMVLYWPLDILKKGVVIIDSPGLDDPYNHDDIAQNYAQKASAIIYLYGADGMRGGDASQLEDLNKLGYRSIMMVQTHYDHVLQKLEDDDGDPERYIRQTDNDFACYSDLDRSAFHHVSSREALDAKRNGNARLLKKSGFEGLEKYLSHYLVDIRGRMTVSSIVGQLCRLVKEIRGNAMMQKGVEREQQSVLQERVKSAEGKIRVARLQGEVVCGKFNKAVDDIIKVKAHRQIESFVKNMGDRITLDNFEQRVQIPQGFACLNPFAVRKAKEKLQEEVRSYLNRQLNQVVQQWTKEELCIMMNEGFEDVAHSIKKDTTDFTSKLQDIYITLDHEQGKTVGGKEIASILGTIILAMSGGGFLDVLISGVYGFGTFAKGTGIALAAGLTLGLLGFTVTLPVAVVTAVLSYMVSIITSGKSQQKSIREGTLKDFRKAMAQQENYSKNLSEITDKVDAFIEEVKLNFKAAIDQDVANANKATEDMRKLAEMDMTARSKKIGEIDAQLEILDKSEQAIKEIGDMYRI